MSLPDTIELSWSFIDVQSLDDSLTDDQAREILQNVKEGQDAELGVNWDVIQCHIDEYKRKKRDLRK